MCGIRYCQAAKVAGGSETFKLAALAAIANNVLNLVRSEYVFTSRLGLFKPIPIRLINLFCKLHTDGPSFS